VTANNEDKSPILPAEAAPAGSAVSGAAQKLEREVGGREGPEPTRYGDWELKGRCIDF
jgi:hypothetical protein